MTLRPVVTVLLLCAVTASAAAALPDSVAPLLSTAWGQTTPYNDMCPEYAAGHRCKTSCVATAMAQVMRRHGYPLRGTGSKTIDWTYGSRSARLSADFAATAYDWPSMLDNYTGAYTDAQALAVATLMYQCGIACNAEYTPDSGAYIDDAFRAMIDHFGYSAQSAMMYRDDFDDPSWTALLKANLAAGMPVFYGGYTASYAGHAFVVDGYDAQGRLHVNWGFGAGGGWYRPDALGSYRYGQSAMMFYPLERPAQVPPCMMCTPGVSLAASVADRAAADSLTVTLSAKNHTAMTPWVTLGLRLISASGDTLTVSGTRVRLADNIWVPVASCSVAVADLPVQGSYECTPVWRADDYGTVWHTLQPTRTDAAMSLWLDFTPEAIKPSASGLDGPRAADALRGWSIDRATGCISLTGDATVNVHTLTGALAATLSPRRLTSLRLTPGIYILTAPGGSPEKIAVQ